MIGSKLSLLLRLLVLASCCAVGFPVGARDLPGDYFPDGTFDTWETEQWFGQYLFGLEEPSLSKMAQKDGSLQCYRVSYFPSDVYAEAFVLTVRSDGAGFLDFQKMELGWNARGDQQPGRITTRSRSVLPKKSVDKFLALLGRIGFWRLPARRPPQGLGGAMYLYEGTNHGKYHAVEVPEPGNDGLDLPARYLMKWVSQ